jgi:oligogalacturonide transport system permease protein
MQIVIPKVIGTAISCTLVAYGFARFEFPGKKILFAVLIATLLLPDVVTRIPQYLLFRELGWLDTYLPLIAPAWLAGDAFFVFMMIQFLRAIPREMEEAARVDGANTAQTLIYIVVPILMPALVSVCLFQFMWTMNDFLGPLIYISTVEKYPVSLALKLSIDATEAFNWNSILAMTVLALTPSLVVFFMAQKSFIEGISTGGVKG